MKYSNCFILLLIILLSNCKKEEQLPPPPPYLSFSSLQLLWRNALCDSGDIITSISPILNSEGDILMSDKYNYKINAELYKLYDGTTGKLKWEWHDYLKPMEYLYHISPLMINDALIFCGNQTIYAFNVLNGQTIWKQQLDTMPGNSIICKDDDGYIYHEYSIHNGGFSTYHIVRTKYDHLNWEEVFSTIDSINSFANNMSITFSKNSKGEMLMFYSKDIEIKYNLKNNRIFCYNLNSKKTEWIKDYSDRMNDNNITPTMYGNDQKIIKVWSTTSSYEDYFLASINANDGSIVWEKKLPNWCRCLIYQDKIICLGAYQNPIQCFYQSSGADAWKATFTSDFTNLLYQNQDIPFIFKNYLFLGIGSNLLVMNLDIGNSLYYKNVALPGWTIDGAVTINEKKRVIYVKDQFYLNCFKLPSEINY